MYTDILYSNSFAMNLLTLSKCLSNPERMNRLMKGKANAIRLLLVLFHIAALDVPLSPEDCMLEMLSHAQQQQIQRHDLRRTLINISESMYDTYFSMWVSGSKSPDLIS